MLRNDLDQHGPRFGCGLAQCGACTVILDGAAVRSCVMTMGHDCGLIINPDGSAGAPLVGIGRA